MREEARGGRRALCWAVVVSVALACGSAGASLAKTMGSTATAPPMPVPLPVTPGDGPKVPHTRTCASCHPLTSRLISATRCSNVSSSARCSSLDGLVADGG